MTVAQIPMTDTAVLETLIRAALADLQAHELHVIDESAAHAGHAGAKAGAHIRLRLVSAAFAGQSRVQRHRMVYERLASLLQGRIHALALELQAPDEAGA